MWHGVFDTWKRYTTLNLIMEELIVSCILVLTFVVDDVLLIFLVVSSRIRDIGRIKSFPLNGQKKTGCLVGTVCKYLCRLSQRMLPGHRLRVKVRLKNTLECIKCCLAGILFLFYLPPPSGLLIILLFMKYENTSRCRCINMHNFHSYLTSSDERIRSS